jgi:hypothetical protein
MLKCTKVMKMKTKVPLNPEILAKIKANEKFRRLTGVQVETYNKMLEILETAEKNKKRKGGRPNKLNMDKRLRMALEYWREYRTYFHISESYGLSESNTYQTIKWIENVLIKDGTFALPGKKALLDENAEYEVILPDATETPIERPKRGKKDTIQERKNVIH